MLLAAQDADAEHPATETEPRAKRPRGRPRKTVAVPSKYTKDDAALRTPNA
jgi:hypothetical protein